MSQPTSPVSSRPANRPGTLPTARHIHAVPVSEAAIAKRAFEKFMARGCAHGFDQEDWTGAEQELNAEASRSVSSHQNEAQRTANVR
jgi:hypothetical protein